MSKKTQYLSGMRTGLPVVFGFIPVGIAYAIMARQAGFGILQTCAMSLSVFAGASQIMAVGMTAQGAGIAAIILATFILNLRHFIMSMCVVNKIKSEKIRVKLLAVFGVTDESFALFTTGDEKRNSSVAAFFGMITVTYASWNIGTFLGAVASDFLPAVVTASLGISLYALFIGLLFPGLNKNWRLAALVAMTAVCNSILTLFIDSAWALIVSTLVCAFAGVFFVDLDGEAKTDEQN